MARLWEIREDFGPDYRHGMDDEIYRAYKKGCKHGYEKAMEELDFRGGGDYRKNEDDEDYTSYRRGGRMRR